ncbi:MAG: gene transfer agent family protein [Xanthobacteraceae bacterium]
MSNRDGKLTRTVAGETCVFRLAWAQLIDMQDALDAGPFVVLQRLESAAWKVSDVTVVLALGLIGGGMDVPSAAERVGEWVSAESGILPFENALLARAVLSAGLVGAPEEDSGNVEAVDPEEIALTISRTVSSGSPRFTQPEPL